jgi:hypothetical protein
MTELAPKRRSQPDAPDTDTASHCSVWFASKEREELTAEGLARRGNLD